MHGQTCSKLSIAECRHAASVYSGGDQPVLEGSANWERIDAAVRKAGLTTTELAKRTGVTFAAAARWRKPKGKGGSEASGEHLRAIAEACGVTVDQLLRVYDGYDPPFASWLAFKGTQNRQD